MAKQNVTLNRFNYGMVSPLAFARTDLERPKLGAEIQTNIIGKALGAGVFRPGLEYITSTKNDAKAKYVPFVFSIDDTALLEFTDNTLRILVNESPISRVSVDTAITNGTFASDLSGWTADDGTGASSFHTATFMALQGNGTNAAKRYQLVSVSGSDTDKEHAVRFEINRGPVTIRIGSTLGGDEYLPETTVEGDGYGPGVYSFTFTPTGDFYIEVSNRENYAPSLIDNISVESSGELTLTTPYTEADLQSIRYTQSGDVVYLACAGRPMKKLLRYSTTGWGIADYSPNDGPFRNINTSAVTLKPSALNGEITLTASSAYFREAMEGALFELTSQGQRTENTLTDVGQATDFIKVIGVGTSREFQITVTGSWTGTLVIERSISEPGAWAPSGETSITANGTFTRDDGADNSIYYYRISTFSDFSGSADITLSIGSGSITGVVRALDYVSPTSMVASVVTPLGGTEATNLWSEGAWSDYRGYPSAVTLHEGRLWWAGKDNLWGSVSDAYESFDNETEGDSGPINIILGSGPIDRIQWLLSLFRLAIGGETAERTARSTSLDEVLTPTNVSIKQDTTRGSSPVQAIAIDQIGFFARNEKVFNLGSTDRISGSMIAQDATILVPEVGDSGFSLLAVQRYPDTRVHCLRNDGIVALLSFDDYEEVQAWQLIETDGVIEDMVVLPAEETSTEDKIYYVVKRTINGADKRYLERWAKEEECIGGNVNKMADSFYTKLGFGVNASSTIVSGLDHLEGEEVIVWADGKDYSSGWNDTQTTYTVTGGLITLPDSVINAVVGLPYKGTYKSTKLAYASRVGEALVQRKMVNYLGLVLQNTHNKGLRFGPDFDLMDDMPRVEDGATVDDDFVWTHYDKDAMEFPGEWNTDSRICLETQAPRPATLLGLIVGMNTNDKV